MARNPLYWTAALAALLLAGGCEAAGARRSGPLDAPQGIRHPSLTAAYTPAAEADRVTSLPGWGATQGLYSGQLCQRPWLLLYVAICRECAVEARGMQSVTCAYMAHAPLGHVRCCFRACIEHVGGCTCTCHMALAKSVFETMGCIPVAQSSSYVAFLFLFMYPD